MDRLVYTYWTNKGNNFLAGFHTVESLLKVFRESLYNSGKFFKEVIVYTDWEGKNFLLSQGIECDYEVIDYDSYDWNKRFWSFPKLITYSLQEKPFLHIDMDVILTSKPTNLNNTIICEKIRPLVMLSKDRHFLPEVIKKNYTPYNICSGILGGDPGLFKILFNVSSQVVKNKTERVDFNMIFGIEEITLSAICKANNIQPTVIDCEFVHYQSSTDKAKLEMDISEKDIKMER